MLGTSCFAMLPWTLLATLSAISTAMRMQLHDNAFRPDWSLHITYERTEIACRSQQVVLVNGTAPGPLITLQENRTSWVRVYNDMNNENLTIHWHGLSQSVAPFSDGTPQASQWPIPPGHFFDYEIHPNIGEAGTYFYHSHVGFQAVSAAGPLIVDEASGKPPYKYDDERIIFLSELYNKTNEQLVGNLLLPPSANSWSGEVETNLINGNSFPALNANETETPLPWQNYSGPAIETCKPEIIHVHPGKTYRLRIIGGVALALVAGAIEEHDKLNVIEADGSYTKPVSVDHIQVGPGQRLDFLLTTKSVAEIMAIKQRDFWVQFETMYRPVTTTSYAILRYTVHDASLSTYSSTIPPSPRPLKISANGSSYLEDQLAPLTANNFPPTSAVSRTVTLTSAQLYGSRVFWSVNNHTWDEDNEHLGGTSVNDTSANIGIPYLVSVYRHGQSAIPSSHEHDSYARKKNVYTAQIGEVVDIIIYNQPNSHIGGFDVHPWHIHGGHVYDLGSGRGQYDATANDARLAARGHTPVLRDTTMLYKYTYGDDTDPKARYTDQGWRAWRLNVTRAGVWMVHCHSLQHMIMGMQTVWIMGNASEITAHSEPYVAGYLDYGGSAYGNKTYDPLVAHFFD